MPTFSRKKDLPSGSLRRVAPPHDSLVPFPKVGHGQLLKVGTFVVVFMLGMAVGEVLLSGLTYKFLREAREAASQAQDLAWGYHCIIAKATMERDLRCE